MSRSFTVQGIRPPDAKWRQMKAVWDACKVANVAAPEEVQEFFGDENPDEKGVVVDLTPGGYRKKVVPGVEEYHDDCHFGYEVDLEKLTAHDPTIKIVRIFYGG